MNYSIKVINAGNCMMCGKKIYAVPDYLTKIVTNKNNEFPNIFFCPQCEKRRVKKDKPQKSEVEK